jgi:hypothetical protein
LVLWEEWQLVRKKEIITLKNMNMITLIYLSSKDESGLEHSTEVGPG